MNPHYTFTRRQRRLLGLASAIVLFGTGVHQAFSSSGTMEPSGRQDCGAAKRCVIWTLDGKSYCVPEDCILPNVDCGSEMLGFQHSHHGHVNP